MPKTYDRNLKSPKFYSTATGREGYNPQITMYYDSDSNIMRVEETWRGKVWAQTISGSNFSHQWPSWQVQEIYMPWEITDV